MLARIPEPDELMDEPAQARAYATADFSEPNALFVDLLTDLAGGALAGRLIDLGCGPAEIPIALARRFPGLAVDALDGAEAMLAFARDRLRDDTELQARVTLHCARLPCASLPARQYDWVVSNSLLHHLADPRDLWQTITHCVAPGSGVVVMDLARPASADAVDALVATHAADAPPVLQRDFRNSLLAAYTPGEVSGQLAAAGLADLDVRMVSDRHLAVAGRLD
jgi:trans-aconitate methyltransferase